MIANTKKVFKIHKKNHKYDSNKITDYFLKILGTTETQIQRNKNLPTRNNDLPDSNVNATLKNYEVANSQKPSITNNSSNSQILSEQTFENNIMSIPEYLSYSTVNSSSNSNYTVINTKKYNNKNSNNYFQSDSDSYTETFKLNNMKQNTIPPKHTMLHYTINDTTDSDSIAICLISQVATTIVDQFP